MRYSVMAVLSLILTACAQTIQDANLSSLSNKCPGGYTKASPSSLAGYQNVTTVGSYSHKLVQETFYAGTKDGNEYLLIEESEPLWGWLLPFRQSAVFALATRPDFDARHGVVVTEDSLVTGTSVQPYTKLPDRTVSMKLYALHGKAPSQCVLHLHRFFTDVELDYCWDSKCR
jgi:hypothetical protein